ncbi:MAG: hypothetical protein ACRCXD_10650 [Luteolibacter sp.]
MKPLPLVFLAVMAIHLPVLSQDTAGNFPEEQAPSPTVARILGSVPDGTPPPPEPPKPKFIVPAKDVLESKSIQQGGRTITVRKINPIALSPPPPPPELLSAEAQAAYRERVAAYREAHPRTKMAFLSATIFRSQDSPPRTLVRCWPEGKREMITFWSSADFGLIAGIHSFADATGTQHNMLMGWGYADVESMSEINPARLQAYGATAPPAFPEGKASFEIIGASLTAEDLAPIQALHDLYNNDHARLKSAFEGRERARLDHEAYLRANPPQPKDITLNYWRTESPAAQQKGEATR